MGEGWRLVEGCGSTAGRRAARDGLVTRAATLWGIGFTGGAVDVATGTGRDGAGAGAFAFPFALTATP